jgi:hypothetical protein
MFHCLPVLAKLCFAQPKSREISRSVYPDRRRGMWAQRVILACLFFVDLTVVTQGYPVWLYIEPLDANGWRPIRWRSYLNSVQVIEASTNMTNWSEIAVTFDSPDVCRFYDPVATNFVQRFYRAATRPKTISDDGQNLITVSPGPDAFTKASNSDSIYWIKFTILLADPTRVWFQNSSKYLLHYDWASLRLAPFKGMSRDQFDAATLFHTNQLAVLGAVLFPQNSPSEYGIQFVGFDAYPPEMIASLFRLVQAAILTDRPLSAYYIPAFEQKAATESHPDYFQSQHIKVSGVERWYTDQSNLCYVGGWAVGRLVYVTAANLNEAYTTGQLKATDILLTDAVPAEVPSVAGIISLSPATPNSHVTILAKSCGIPFLYVGNPATQAQLTGLVGKTILLRLPSGDFGPMTPVLNYPGWEAMKISAFDGPLDPGLQAAILALKKPAPVNYAAKAKLGSLWTNVDALLPGDSRYFGGKAANLGLVRRILPTNSPTAIAFSFDLWDDFLNQTLPGSAPTLRQQIHDRLARYTYPPDLAAAQADLAAIRDLITKTASFSAAQKTEILQAVASFAPDRKVRFRSSTNVEDSEQFTGAGLYDSFSGCLADDLAEDPSGPSICDPTEPKKRGVFRAMQKVYASFYNDNAWLQRLQYGLNEDDFGMAILAHHSFPDEIEMANGVATLHYQPGSVPPSGMVDLVTQAGATSVTNPEAGAVAELVHGYLGSGLYTTKYSNLAALGGNVMHWDQDYRNLLDLLQRVAAGYAVLFPNKTGFVLDFEYKKVQPGALVVKQVRELAAPAPAPAAPSILLNESEKLVMLAGDPYLDTRSVFEVHFLKCRLSLNIRDILLASTNTLTSFYTNSSFEFLAGTNVVCLSNSPAMWPEARFLVGSNTVTDSYAYGTDTTRRAFSLQTTLFLPPDATACPVITLRDLPKTVTVQFATPQSIPRPNNSPIVLSNAVIQFVHDQVAAPPPSQAVNRTLTNQAGLHITTTYDLASEDCVGMGTCPLLAFKETRITGLTSEPIVLNGYFSQSYKPIHHDVMEYFIFEPQLDPQVTSEQRQQLADAKVKLLYVECVGFPWYQTSVPWSQTPQTIWAQDFDGNYRILP